MKVTRKASQLLYVWSEVEEVEVGEAFTSPVWPERRTPGRPAWRAVESRLCWCCRRRTRCWAGGGSLPKRRSRRRGRCGPWLTHGSSVCGSQSAKRITGQFFKLQVVERPLVGNSMCDQGCWITRRQHKPSGSLSFVVIWIFMVGLTWWGGPFQPPPSFYAGIYIFYGVTGG